MQDEVADALDTDVILPVSSVKPEYKAPSRLITWLTGEARTDSLERLQLTVPDNV